MHKLARLGARAAPSQRQPCDAAKPHCSHGAVAIVSAATREDVRAMDGGASVRMGTRHIHAIRTSPWASDRNGQMEEPSEHGPAEPPPRETWWSEEEGREECWPRGARRWPPRDASRASRVVRPPIECPPIPSD